MGDGCPYSDAAGGAEGNNPFRPTPANDTASGPYRLEELIGAFANAQGVLVDAPFVVGNGGSFEAPAGTAELLLGINGAYFADNMGAYQVRVSDAVSTVPLPASAPMFGAALLALAAAGRRLRRAKATAAA